MEKKLDELVNRSAKKLFSAGHSIMFVWENIEGWPVRFVSENVERILGYSVEEFVSGKIEYAKLIHPDDIEQVEAEVEKNVQNSEDHTFTHQDYRVKTKSGKYLCVRDTTYFQPQEENEFGYYVGYITDVTDFYDAKKALEEQRERLELVLDGSNLGLWDWNPQTNEVVFDERWAKLVGHELGEIENNLDTWSTRVHPDDLEGCFKEIEKHMSGETESYQHIHRMKHKNGNWVYIHDRGRIYKRDSEGKPIRFTGSHEDVTKRIETELELEKQRLQALEKEKFVSLAQLGAGVAHEINNPLTIAMGFLTKIKKFENMDDKQLECAAKVEDQLDRITKIVKSLLIFSRQDSHYQTDEKTDLLAVINNIQDLTAEKFKSRGIKLDIQLDTKSTVINASNVQIGQVILNLFVNAIDAITDLDEKWIKVILEEPEEDRIKLTIQDSGSGIPDEVAENIFNPFFTTKEIGKGTGLGLSLSKGIIESFNGTLSLKLIDEHTAFVLEFPKAKS